MPLIYIEGPDGSGKTSLVKTIIDKVDIYYHNGVYHTSRDACANYLNQIRLYEELQHDTKVDLTMVLDRGIIAETIYGPIMRGESPNPEEVYTVMAALREVKAEVTICLPPLEVALNNWSSRLGEEYIQKEEQYINVYNAYEEYALTSGVNTYDYTKEQ